MKSVETAQPSIPLAPDRVEGRLLGIQGETLTAVLPQATIGLHVAAERVDGTLLSCQVASFSGNQITLVPFGRPTGLAPGARIFSQREALFSIPENPLGKILNCFGLPLEEDSELPTARKPLPDIEQPISPLRRVREAPPFESGIPVIDLFTPLIAGQRVGIFASAGSGKSSLLVELAEHSSADVSILALIGERGCEAAEIAKRTLSEGAESKTIVIAATSDEPPICQHAALVTAVRCAEKFRSEGKHVLLLVDSITRAARALRELALSAGELPVRLGYPASVFRAFPQIVERCGATETGAITAFFTVLIADQEGLDPVAEEFRSLLDGHLILDHTLAERGRYPAVDISRSLSRVSHHQWSGEQKAIIRDIRKILTEAVELRESQALLGRELSSREKTTIDRGEKIEDLLYARSPASAAWNNLNELRSSWQL